MILMNYIESNPLLLKLLYSEISTGAYEKLLFNNTKTAMIYIYYHVYIIINF